MHYPENARQEWHQIWMLMYPDHVQNRLYICIYSQIALYFVLTVSIDVVTKEEPQLWHDDVMTLVN